MRASFVFAAAVAAATITPVAMALYGIGLPNPSAFGFFDNAGEYSEISDAAGDAQPVLQRSNTSIIPEAKPYHDLVGASIRKQQDGSLDLTMRLAGDPNRNEKFETNYMWNIVGAGGEGRDYAIMLINFPPGFFDIRGNTSLQGWYYAVFDRTANDYVVPQAKTLDMPSDRVEFRLDSTLIGNPQSFRYWVSVYTRVNNTSFDFEPEYLMDYAP